MLPVSGSAPGSISCCPRSRWATTGASPHASDPRRHDRGVGCGLRPHRARQGAHGLEIVFRHALRNAIVPVVALAAVQLGYLLGGSVVIETIFALDGLGYLAYQSITYKDYPVMQLIVLLLSVLYVLLTLAADIANAWLDPRASGCPDMTTPTLTPLVPGAPAPIELTASTLRWRRLRRNKALLAGGGILFVIVMIALLAPWISPHDPYFQDLAYRTAPPVWYAKGTWLHPLGTDQLGRDSVASFSMARASRC